MTNTIRRVQNQTWWDAQDRKHQIRQENAKARKGRSPAQQLKVLDDRLGVEGCYGPIVAIQESVVQDLTGPAEVDMDNLHDAEHNTLVATGEFAWYKQLKDFCKVMNIKWSQPK